MKRYFSLLLLSSISVCLAAGQNEDLQTKVAAMARILSEVYDESKGCIKQPDTVQTKRNLYELQQLARDLKIGIRDKSSHGPSRLCSLCIISLLHDPRFQALPKPSKEDKKEELVCYATCGGVCFCDKDGAAKRVHEGEMAVEGESSSQAASLRSAEGEGSPWLWMNKDDPFKGTKFDW